MDIFIQLIVNSLIAAALYAMIAVGFNMVYSVSKFFDLAYGTIAVLGAYFVFYFYNLFPDFSLVVITAGGIFFGGFFYFLIQKIFYQKFEERKSSNVVMLVVSLGIMTITQALVAIFFTSQFQTIYLNFESNFKILGAVITPIQVILIFSSIFVFFLIFLFYKFTSIGKKAKALADDPFMSEIVGINTKRIRAIIFFIAGAVVAFAGILSFMDVGIEPTSGFTFLLNSVAAFIIGGPGNFLGSLVGAVIIGFVENFGVFFISGQWKEALTFIVLILFLIFRPDGIFKSKKQNK